MSKLDAVTFVHVETTDTADYRHRLVSMARLGLFPQDGSNDDQTKEVPRRQGERRRQIEGEEEAIGQSISDPCVSESEKRAMYYMLVMCLMLSRIARA